MIPLSLVSKWMFFVRENPQYLNRFSECFWPSQMISKSAALKLLDSKMRWTGKDQQVYVFGGWYGIFAQIIHERYQGIKIYNIDIDPSCEFVFNSINTSEQIAHITSDMAEFEYPTNPDLVINTSTEHLSQETYDTWWNKIPSGTIYLIQGNNFFESHEHVRCSNTLEEFLKMNYLDSGHVIECGIRSDQSPFYRFMSIGIKI